MTGWRSYVWYLVCVPIIGALSGSAFGMLAQRLAARTLTPVWPWIGVFALVILLVGFITIPPKGPT